MSVLITADPIRIDDYGRRADTTAGAVVTFTGVVRRTSGGRDDVAAMFYDCYTEMTEKELGRITEEAKRDFDALEVFACHRVGKIAVGETSVSIIVTAAHRAAAFRACAYIIDQAKHRLPIWKKEHYVDGTSRWI